MKKCEHCKKEYVNKELPSGKIHVLADCDCEKEKRDHALDEIKQQEKYKSLIADSHISKIYFDNNYPISNENLKLLLDFKWIGVDHYLIYGNYGVYKTTQVLELCKEAMKAGYSTSHWNASRLALLDFDEVRRIISHLEKVNILVLDNFGKNVKSEDSRNIVFDLLDFRRDNYKSNVIITNELLEGKIDGAMWDRFKEYRKIEFTGDSKRGEVAK